MAGKLKIGIIGTGGIAADHAKTYRLMPDAEIAAVADIVPGRAAAFAKAQSLEGARIYTGHREMLEAETLDAVSVCVYNAAHADCTIAALEKGVNVLVEKPLCVTMDEAAAIIKAEKKSGKIVSVGFQPRFDENMKLLKRIVESGELGEVYYIQTGGGRRRGIPGASFISKDTAGIGALADIGCYALDMVLNAVGYPKPLTVTGCKYNFFGTNPAYSRQPEAFGVDDFAAAFIRLAGGLVVDFRISWAMHADTTGDTLLLGKKGALRIPSTECWNGAIGPLTLYHDILGQPSETVIPQLETKEDLTWLKIRTFLDAVLSGGPAPVPTSQILYNQAIIDAIARSAQLGKEIDVEIPEC